MYKTDNDEEYQNLSSITNIPLFPLVSNFFGFGKEPSSRLLL